MRIARIVKAASPLEIIEADVPSPPPRGAVIKTRFSGICHSDLNQLRNTINHGDVTFEFTDNPKYNFPITPGHEIAGEVLSLGPENDPEADDLKIGDQVVAFPWIGCGNCGYCNNKAVGHCNDRTHGLGIGTPGGYSTHVVVRDKRYLVKVPKNIPMEVACMLPCSGLTTFNALSTLKPDIEKIALYKGRASVLIIGAGGLALWCIQIAKHVLPPSTKIVVADINKTNLEIAKQRGCDETIFWDRELSEDKINALTKASAIDGLFDGVIDVVNSSVTFQRAYECTDRGSTMIMLGLFGGAGRFSLPKMVHGYRTFKGVLTGHPEQLRDLVKLVAAKQLTSPPLQFFTLDDAYKAMCLVKEHKIQGRCIIKHEN